MVSIKGKKEILRELGKRVDDLNNKYFKGYEKKPEGVLR